MTETLVESPPDLFADPCPDAATHTPVPDPLDVWKDWIEDMVATHVQTRCPTCGYWVIWKPKR